MSFNFLPFALYIFTVTSDMIGECCLGSKIKTCKHLYQKGCLSHYCLAGSGREWKGVEGSGQIQKELKSVQGE